MGTDERCPRAIQLLSYRLRTSASIGAVALAALGACAPPASAHSNPLYSLSVTEGETAQAEFQIAGTGAGAPGGQQVSVVIVRGGTEVARSTGVGGTGMSQIPQAGDVVTLESPRGTPIGSEVYDGLPSIDPTVCAGSTNFSGQRTPNFEVEGGYYSFKTHSDPYGSYLERTNFVGAQVTTLSGTAFGGSFLSPLAGAETVYAVESTKSPLPGGGVFEYSSESARPVGGCPAPPVVVPPPPAPPALQGSFLKLATVTIRKLLRFGWSDRVGINQPGTVTQDLYLQGGTLPAYAATSKPKRHAKPKPALLLARGTATAKVPGAVTVSLKLTARGRRKLKTAKKANVILITTLRTTSGQTLSLERRTLSFHH